jgi:hypothetical protein
VLAPLVALAADDLESLGFDPVQLKLALFGALRGSFDAPDIPSAVRSLSAEQKVAAVQTLGAFAKVYFGSAEFKTDYLKAYQDSKPHRGSGLPAINVKGLAKSAADKAVKKDKPNEAWQLDKNPKAQLRKRLQTFLAATEDVDYAATTHENGSLKIFDKPEDEAKSHEWKMCYRAGRETGEAVRGVARDWLAELK